MAAFEGIVSIFDKNGTVEIRRVSSGGYAASEVADLVADLVEAKKPVSRWSLWIDGIDVKAAEAYSPTVFSKLIKGNSVELIAVRRKGRNGGFMAPVMKITAPGAATAKAAPNKARIGR